MPKQTPRMPVKKRYTQVRALIQWQESVTVADVSNHLGVTEPRAQNLLTDLKNMGHVYVSGTSISPKGQTRYHYSLTDSYIRKINYGRAYREKQADTKHVEVKRAEATERKPAIFAEIERRPNKPWYKRALSWLTGDSDLRTGA